MDALTVSVVTQLPRLRCVGSAVVMTMLGNPDMENDYDVEQKSNHFPPTFKIISRMCLHLTLSGFSWRLFKPGVIGVFTDASG